MNATLHQLKWDFRRIRTLWIVWIVLLIAGAFASLHAGAAPGPERGLTPVFTLGKIVSTYVLAVLLVARLMYSTPFAGAQAFWKTRPLAQRSLFWAKSLLILCAIQLPVSLSQVAGWLTMNFSGTYLFWASIHFSALTLSIFLLAAVWAALCERFASFGVCLASTGGVPAACAIASQQIGERIKCRPVQPATAEA
jgi:hypothetical protein